MHRFIPIFQTNKFEWKILEWGKCSIPYVQNTCLNFTTDATGEQKRDIICTDRFGEEVHYSRCTQKEPATKQPCKISCPTPKCILGQWNEWRKSFEFIN